jgi:hypothetical protein
MNRTSLSSLYRRLTQGADAVALDAGDLAAAAGGTLAADRREQVAQVLASSSAQASVVRMLRALKSESETLAADVARTARETTHRRHQRGDRRVAASRRGRGIRRWAAAAACLVAVVGAWTLNQHKSRPDAAAASAAAVADVIFSTREADPHDRIFGDAMDRSLAQHGKKPRHEGDVVFRGDFAGG